MDDRFNTAAGWVLFAGIIALGLSILSGKYFHADKAERPEVMGYPIAGVVTDEGGPAEMSMSEALNMMSQDELIAAGERVFAKCQACHTIEQGGANGIGPNLYGTMGSTIGAHAAGFAYSAALSGKGGQWDWESMNEWLKKPSAFAEGTSMSFAGLNKIEDRAAVAMYINSYGSNLPVPEFVAAVAEEAVEAGDASEEPAEEAAGEATEEAAAE
ncbi:c-type cytochrome [Altererythrobacter sp. GH1-8]|uniref:c-type cytochrome n=1 Tax=Altererythrobacter sp. GH1-8 TaxID=3349333 RepID=UPI00374CB228